MSFAKAINSAIVEEMKRDSSIILFGEEVGLSGGRFGVTKNLLNKFGSSRVLDTPINEEIFVGMGIGAALTGLRPIIELMYSNFLTIAIDDIYRSGLWPYLYGEKAKIPIVIRMPILGYCGVGPEISSPLLSLVLSIPGIKIVVPSNSYDAKGLLKTAIRDNGPVLLFEHVQLYKEQENIPKKEYLVPFGKAIIRNIGNDVTIVACSLMVSFSLKAAKILKEKGVNVEVLDLRTLIPLDIKTILNSVSKTKKVVIVEEDIKRGGIGAEIGIIILENIKDVEIKRVATNNSLLPYGSECEKNILPNCEKIINAVFNLMNDNEK